MTKRCWPAPVSFIAEHVMRVVGALLIGGGVAAAVLAAAPPARAQSFAFYACRDSTEFIVAFYQGRRAASLKLDGMTITLPRRISASGSRYVKGDIMFWINGRTAILKRGRHVTECITD